MITLIGMGSGTPESLTAQGLAALQNAGLILGAKRLLEQLPQGCTEHRKALYQPEDVLAALAADPEVDAALVYSGDTGFYSGAAQLLPMLRAFGISCRVLPGFSSVQLLAAAVGRSWQEWKLVSAHGCACDPVAECLTAGGKPVFFLTGGAETPASLCGRLAAAGLGDAHVLVGEELGRAEEKILFGTAQEFAQKQFASLSVLLVEHVPQPPRRVPGFPDEAFHRGEVPMTKQEVRAAALAKLAVQPADTLWDVGAGTGSVSVELALAAPRGHVYAVECDPEACGLIRQNRETFHACNLTLVEGRAPAALADLPAPDAVFIGGTKGGMEAVVDTVLARNPNARICISAIALETENVNDPISCGRALFRQRQNHTDLRSAGGAQAAWAGPLLLQERAGLYRSHVSPGRAGGGKPQPRPVFLRTGDGARALCAGRRRARGSRVRGCHGLLRWTGRRE